METEKLYDEYMITSMVAGFDPVEVESASGTRIHCTSGKTYLDCFSGIAATFCPVIVLSLSWPRFNVRGALASMVTGAVCVPLFKFAVPGIPVWGPVISRAEELAPSFLLSLVAGVVVTLAFPTTGDSSGSGAQ